LNETIMGLKKKTGDQEELKKKMDAVAAQGKKK
jgi:hypothetical protein